MLTKQGFISTFGECLCELTFRKRNIYQKDGALVTCRKQKAHPASRRMSFLCLKKRKSQA